MWQGDKTNRAPNAIKEPIDRSEKYIGDNRALDIRRDKDTQKDFAISLQDIDQAIMSQLEQLQLQVEDSGQKIKVPVLYGSMQTWVAASRDGFLRDKQGKLILPAMIFKRTGSESDSTLKFFNRYLNVPVIKLHSQKNQYTQFSTLIGKVNPVHEVYNVVIPSHMLLTYHFIIWTEYVEQMNKLVETIQFNTQDYWGSSKGFRFRTKVESYSHTTELQAGEDRIVKSEFDLTTHGYILPDTMTKLERHKMTTQKYFTPKKVIMGLEVVSTDYDFSKFNSNSDKKFNPNYPNLTSDIPVSGPAIGFDMSDITGIKGIKVDNSPLFLRIVPVPTTQFSNSQDGSMSYDKEYFYFHTGGQWRRVAISEFIPVCSDNIPIGGSPGNTSFNNQFFYIYSNGGWKKVSIATIDLSTPGNEGDVMYDTNYFYIYTNGYWRRLVVSAFN